MKTPFVSGYCPVSRLARYGQHTGVPETAVSKLTDWAASRSSMGARTFESPLYPVDCARHSSARMSNTLGRRRRWANTAGAAAVEKRNCLRFGFTKSSPASGLLDFKLVGEISRAAFRGIALVVLIPCVPKEWNAHALGSLHLIEEPLVQFPDRVFALRVEDQVGSFERVLLEIVELVGVPDAVVVNVLVAVSAECMHRRGLGEVPLPVVLVQELLAPVWIGLAAEERQHAAPVEALRDRRAGGAEHAGHDVEISDHLVDDAAAGEQLGTAREHRDAHRLL